MDGKSRYLKNRIRKLSCLASLDTFKLDFYLNHFGPEAATMKSNDAVILSEMELYQKVFMLNNADVRWDITQFLISIGENELARMWNEIGREIKEISIDVDYVPDDVIDVKNAGSIALVKSQLLSKLLNRFYDIARSKTDL